MHCVGFDIASPKLAVSEINLSADTGMRKYEMARRQCSAIACVCSNVIFCKEKIIHRAKEVTAHKAVTEIITHNTTPCINGLKPTACKDLRDSPQPIRKSVTVKPALAIPVK